MDRGPLHLIVAGAVAAGGCGFSPSGGTVDASIDAPCAPGCSPAGDEAVTCGPGGQTVRQPCTFGCVDDVTGPVCATDLIPSNVDPTELTTFDLAEATGGLPFEEGFRIAVDADLGAIYKYPPTGPFIGLRPAVTGISNTIGFEKVSATLSVLAVAELRVTAGSTLEVFGTRSLVILVGHDAIIDGAVRADAGLCDSFNRRPGCNGAGGGRGGGDLGLVATGCAPGGTGTIGARDTGGGGGGMATTGGVGGSSGTAAGGAATADLSACASEALLPLSGGGGGGRSAASAAVGGGGGGALQITAFGTLRLGPSGVITAVGAGGQGTLSNNNGGGGGGAGGAILLEAPTLDIGGGVISVGGGGGGGGRTTGHSGEAGRTDGMPALGGVGDGPAMADGLGGNGAINSVGALDGRGNAAGDLDGTGGGGGGLGRIRANSVRGDTAAGGRFVGRYSAGRTFRRSP